MLIGLTGRMGAGKDTVYERIKALLPNETVTRRAFADPLKNSVCALFGITREQLEQMKNNRHAWVHLVEGDGGGSGHSVREFLQRYGTEAHRHIFGSNFWLDQTLPYSEKHRAGTGDTSYYLSEHVLVITDCRFPNEAQRVRDCGGKVFEVVGPEGPMDPDAPHASERALPANLIAGYIDNRARGDGFAWLDSELRLAGIVPQASYRSSVSSCTN